MRSGKPSRNTSAEVEPSAASPSCDGAVDAQRAGPGSAADGDPAGSVTMCLGELKRGDADALTPIWIRYFEKLVRLADARLKRLPGARAVRGGEDLAASAFASFCNGLKQGRFPRLDDRDDLWRILVRLAARKVIDQNRHEHRAKRGAGRVVREADVAADAELRLLDDVLGREPSPELAAMAAEEFGRLMQALGDDTLRRIAELKMALCTNREIAEELGCSLRSVTLKLELIRKIWKPDTPA